MGLDSVTEEGRSIGRGHRSPVHDQRQGVPYCVQVDSADTGIPPQQPEPLGVASGADWPSYPVCGHESVVGVAGTQAELVGGLAGPESLQESHGARLDLLHGDGSPRG